MTLSAFGPNSDAAPTPEITTTPAFARGGMVKKGFFVLVGGRGAGLDLPISTPPIDTLSPARVATNGS